MRALLFALVLSGCAGATPVPVVPDVRRVETAELPPDPAQEALPSGLPAGEWVEAMEAGSCGPTSRAPCPPRSGILVSEARAVRDGYYRVRYPELRRLYETDRRVWAAHRELYEQAVQTRDAAIQQLQPDWFQRNAFSLGFGAGAVIVGAVVAIVAGAL